MDTNTNLRRYPMSFASKNGALKVEKDRLVDYIRYDGAVKQQYGLTLSEAVVAFLINRLRRYDTVRCKRTCLMSYATVRSIHQSLCDKINRTLKSLVDKRVVLDFSYQKKQAGSISVTLRPEFCKAVAAGNHYVKLRIFNFHPLMLEKMTLTDKVFYGITYGMLDAGMTPTTAAIASMMGMSPRAIMRVRDKAAKNKWVYTDTLPANRYGVSPVVVTEHTIEGVQRPYTWVEYKKYLEQVYWLYKNSASMFITDAYEVIKVYRRMDHRYAAMCDQAERIMRCEDEHQGMRRASLWLRKWGAGTEPYKRLVGSMYTESQQVLTAPNFAAVDEYTASHGLGSEIWIVRDGVFFEKMPYDPASITPIKDEKTGEWRWCLGKTEFPELNVPEEEEPVVVEEEKKPYELPPIRDFSEFIH